MQVPGAGLAGHVTAEQSKVAAFLADPSSHGESCARVERIDTHGAMIFLAGERAYKVKRAVRFPYMDFSTLELRRRACTREIELNRRTAPELYIGTVAITRTADGALMMGGPGEAVEWAVVMRRFPQEALGDHLAQAGRFTLELASTLADEVAAFHDRAEPLPHGAGGGAAGLRAVIDENGSELRQRPDLFPTAEVASLAAAADEHLGRVAGLLDNRMAEGLVRHCHGDLHLRNVCVINGRPRIFDCIEFNDAIACVDVLYDLAFLLMDLQHRGLRPHANLVLNRYLQRRDDIAGLAALPLFLSTRAAVRAKVSVSVADSQTDPAAARALCDEAAGYFRAAQIFLQPVTPCLIAIGGLSGTGKTCLARDLAPGLGASPGALHLRSDVLRKSHHGVDELHRLPPSAYGAAQSTEIYARLTDHAKAGLAAGRAVIADAVYSSPAERAAIEAVARELGVHFVGIWLEAPAEQIIGRVAGRRGDASDATPDVVRQQLTYDIGQLTWQRLDASGDRAAIVAEAQHLISTGR
jgi:hypothetical protein